MTPSFGQALAEWKDFYVFVGTAAATLLGLLFVSVSLRLDLFHEAQLADVRDFAAQTFAQFFSLVLIAALFLIPHQSGADIPVGPGGSHSIGAAEVSKHSAGSCPLCSFADPSSN
jgi:hypothetical protein